VGCWSNGWCVWRTSATSRCFTDKTGTLTEGRISLRRCLSATGEPSSDPLLLGLLANQASVQDGAPVGGNPLDVALWQSPEAAGQPVAEYRRVALLPFDHERRRVSVLVDGPTGRQLITKGAPEELLTLCTTVPDSARVVLDDELDAGSRVPPAGPGRRRRAVGPR
jgi:Mg2+-importing ATPase